MQQLLWAASCGCKCYRDPIPVPEVIGLILSNKLLSRANALLPPMKKMLYEN